MGGGGEEREVVRGKMVRGGGKHKVSASPSKPRWPRPQWIDDSTGF